MYFGVLGPFLALLGMVLDERVPREENNDNGIGSPPSMVLNHIDAILVLGEVIDD
jgi:hypothetical protein